MRSILLIIAVALIGCDGLFGIRDPQPRSDASSAIDGSATEPLDARECWATGIEVCFTTPPSGPIMLAGTLDTTSDARCSPDFSTTCVIAGGSISIEATATLTVAGTRPLVLVASDELTIAGTLDIASHAQTPAQTGPGAVSAVCHQFGLPPPDTNNTDGTGGGAGGSFGDAGGAGGGNASGAHGGAVSTDVEGKAFGAGCRGEDGANPNPGSSTLPAYGLGGAGGGATYLIGGTAILISGIINASGAGGLGGECTSPCDGSSSGKAHGGGGGGAGGMIVLEAPSIANTGSIFADGGGGGEGASHSETGASGADPSGSAPAAGGSAEGNHHGGPGGAGVHAGSVAGTGGDGSNDYGGGGGGGGGGGAGKIVVYGTTLTGNASPAPMM
jgi:hypothetical protein